MEYRICRGGFDDILVRHPTLLINCPYDGYTFDNIIADHSTILMNPPQGAKS